MPSFRVWDPLSEQRPDDCTHDAYDAQSAAEKYAEEDGDGNADNIYGRPGGHDIHVEDDDGAVHVFRVQMEFEPVYYARRRAAAASVSMEIQEGPVAAAQESPLGGKPET